MLQRKRGQLDIFMHAEMKSCLQCLMKLCRLKDISLLLSFLLALSLSLGREKYGQLWWWITSSSMMEGDWTPPFCQEIHLGSDCSTFAAPLPVPNPRQWEKAGMALFKGTINIILQIPEKISSSYSFMPVEYPVSLFSCFSHKNGHTSGYWFCGFWFFCLTDNISSVFPLYFTWLLQLMHPVVTKAIRSRD